MSYDKIVDYAPDKNIVKAGRERVGAADCSSLSSQLEVAWASRFTGFARNLTTIMQREDTELIVSRLYRRRPFDIKVTECIVPM